MSKIKKATDAKAVIVCRRWIEKALKLGVVLKPGTYGWRDYAKNKPVLFACAIGSMEHAVSRGRETGTGEYESLAKKINHGVTVGQLAALEEGFEGDWWPRTGTATTIGRHRALMRLGAEYRAKAIKKLDDLGE